MNLNSLIYWYFFALSVGNIAAWAGERYDWWGNPAAPHFSHVSAALVWIAIAALYKRTSP